MIVSKIMPFAVEEKKRKEKKKRKANRFLETKDKDY